MVSEYVSVFVALYVHSADDHPIRYYNSNTGQYNGGELWTDSVCSPPDTACLF
jgi:hypothetical protein